MYGKYYLLLSKKAFMKQKEAAIYQALISWIQITTEKGKDFLQSKYMYHTPKCLNTYSQIFKISWIIENEMYKYISSHNYRALCIVDLRTFSYTCVLNVLWIPFLELRIVSYWEWLQKIFSLYNNNIAFILIVIAKLTSNTSSSFSMYKESCYCTLALGSCFLWWLQTLYIQIPFTYQNLHPPLNP